MGPRSIVVPSEASRPAEITRRYARASSCESPISHLTRSWEEQPRPRGRLGLARSRTHGPRSVSLETHQRRRRRRGQRPDFRGLRRTSAIRRRYACRPRRSRRRPEHPRRPAVRSPHGLSNRHYRGELGARSLCPVEIRTSTVRHVWGNTCWPLLRRRARHHGTISRTT